MNDYETETEINRIVLSMTPDAIAKELVKLRAEKNKEIEGLNDAYNVQAERAEKAEKEVERLTSILRAVHAEVMDDRGSDDKIATLTEEFKQGAAPPAAPTPQPSVLDEARYDEKTRRVFYPGHVCIFCFKEQCDCSGDPVEDDRLRAEEKPAAPAPRHQFYCSQCRQFWVRSFGQWEYLSITDGDARSEICPECHKTNVEKPAAAVIRAPFERPKSILAELKEKEKAAPNATPPSPRHEPLAVTDVIRVEGGKAAAADEVCVCGLPRSEHHLYMKPWHIFEKKWTSDQR